MVGASGAISGVLGAYLFLFPHARVLTLIMFGFFIRFVHVPAIIVLGFWIVMQVFNGLISVGRMGMRAVSRGSRTSAASRPGSCCSFCSSLGDASPIMVAVASRGSSRQTPRREGAPAQP